MRWKAWLDNGKTYSSDDCAPNDIPSDGVLVIVEKKRDRTITVHEGRDYYFWNGENWVSGELASMEKWMRAIVPALKFGRWTADGIFREAIDEANRWP